MATNSSKLAQPGTARITLFYSDKKKFTVGKSLLSQGKPLLAQARFLSQNFHKDIIHVSLRRTYTIDVIYMLHNVIYKDGPPEEEPGLVAAKTCCVFIRISPIAYTL